MGTGTLYNSTSTEHHPATLSESTTTASSEILSFEEDRASSDSDVSSLQTYSSEESSVDDYGYTEEYRTTSEDVGTPTSQSMSYVTHYQYITATEIVTLVPSSLSVSRVLVTLSPVSTEELDEFVADGDVGREVERTPDTYMSMVSSTLVYYNELLVTQMTNGHTVVQNHYTTVTLRSTSTILPDPKELARISARRRRRIGLGCGLGIGIPVLLAVVFTIYFVFIRSRKVDTIDPEGKIVTSYKMNKLKRAWYMLLGRELPGYGADAPVVDLGDEESELSDGRAYGQQGESVNRSVSRSTSGSDSSNWGGNVFNEKIEEPGAGVATDAAPVDSAAAPTAPAVAAATAVPGPDTGYDGARSGVDNVAGVIDDTSTMSSESFIGVSPLEGNPGYAGGFLYEDIPQDYYNYNHVSVNDASVERRDTDGYLSNRRRVSGTGSSGVGSGSRTGSSGRSDQGTQDNIFSDSHAY